MEQQGIELQGAEAETEEQRQRAKEEFLTAWQQRGVTTEEIWTVLGAYAGYVFHTFRGLEFSYTVRGGEMFIDRRSKSITDATVRLFLDRVRILQQEGVAITGPKKVGCFGASYLYPVFMELGVISQLR